MTLFRTLEVMGGGGDDAMNEICVVGCNRPSKVRGGCNVQQAGSTG